MDNGAMSPLSLVALLEDRCSETTRAAAFCLFHRAQSSRWDVASCALEVPEKANIYLVSMLLKIHAPNDVSRTPSIATRGDLMNRERKHRTAWRNGSKLVRPRRDDHVRHRYTSMNSSFRHRSTTVSDV